MPEMLSTLRTSCTEAEEMANICPLTLNGIDLLGARLPQFCLRKIINALRELRVIEITHFNEDR